MEKNLPVPTIVIFSRLPIIAIIVALFVILFLVPFSVVVSLRGGAGVRRRPAAISGGQDAISAFCRRRVIFVSDAVKNFD